MNVLKSENEGLKKLLYENEDYNNNINMEDKSKEMNDRIEKCTTEKNLLQKQLKVHKKCLEEQNEYNMQYNSLKDELKQIKKNIQNVRSETMKLMNTNSNQSRTNIKNNLSIGVLSQEGLNKKSNRYNSITSPSSNVNITKSQKKLIKTSNNNRKVVLPLISVSRTINQNKEESILNEDFTTKLKEYLEKEDEYISLITKIKNIEQSRRLIEAKHRNELKQFNSQLASLDEQYKILKDKMAK